MKVNISRESYEDVQPKASVAANTGAGPDLFWGLYSLPHLFPQKCLDVTDVADYLGKKYGGWVPTRGDLRQGHRQQVDRHTDLLQRQPDELPRRARCKRPASRNFPATTDEFLEYAKATKAEQHARRHGVRPCLGRRQWLDPLVPVVARRQRGRREDKVIINSPETEKALNYAKALYGSMIPGTASWNDAFNNKAFLAGEIHWTNNGISIYAAATARPQPEGDRRRYGSRLHAGRPGRQADRAASAVSDPGDELHQVSAGLQSADGVHAGSRQFQQWLEGSVGYLTHCLNAYDANPVWTADPKRTVYRDVAKRTLTAGGLGSVGEKAAAAIADFVLVDMFASYCTGREDAKGAMKIAERQLQRIYR